MKKNSEQIVLCMILCAASLISTIPYFGGTPFYFQDEATHLMNGILIFDFLRAIPLSLAGPLEWVKLYYAHYPSIGPFVWPPFFYCTEAAFIAFGGASIESGQIAVAFFLFLLLWGWYTLMRRYLSIFFAFLGVGALLFAPCLWVVSHYVMLDIPSLALIPWTILAALRYLERRSPGREILAIASVIAMLLTKQSTIIAVPVLFMIFYGTLGWKGMIRTSFFVPWLFGTGVVLFYYYVSFIVQRVNASDVLGGWSLASHLDHFIAIFSPFHMGFLALALGIAGIVGWWKVASTRKPWFLPLLLVFNLIFCAAISIADVRYFYYMIPSLVFMGLFVLERGTSGSKKRLVPWILAASLLGQAVFTVTAMRIDRLEGFGPVASYAMATSETKRVLFVGSRAHSFIQSVRELDDSLEMFVFRDSKILYTANWYDTRDFDVYVRSGVDVVDVLRAFAIDIVVVSEDANSISPLIEGPLREAIASGKLTKTKSFAATLGNRNLAFSAYRFDEIETIPSRVSLQFKTVKSEILSHFEIDISRSLMPE